MIVDEEEIENTEKIFQDSIARATMITPWQTIIYRQIEVSLMSVAQISLLLGYSTS
jgi:hypothetical protein